jgi:nucleotide-binding universal stress UspA family protein
MKKVLVPIDGSATSLRALNILTRKRALYRDPAEMEIHLLNVQHPVSGDVDMFVDHEQIKKYHREQSLEALKAARDLLDKAGIPYIFHIGIGDPGEVIALYAKEKGCDQIIMGTRGRGELAGLLLGSVTWKVIHLAEIPILLVK